MTKRKVFLVFLTGTDDKKLFLNINGHQPLSADLQEQLIHWAPKG